MELSQAVLAAFYNDARLNILACLNDIRNKQGLSLMQGDEHIVSAFYDLSQILTNGTPEESSALIKDLRYRFPFLDARTDASEKNKGFTPLPENYHQILEWMFKLLNGLRNSVVHPCDQPFLIDIELHKNIFFLLNDIYDDGHRLLKTRFDWTTNDIKPLLRYDQRGKLKIKRFSFVLCSDPKKRSNSPVLGQKKVFYSFGHVLFCSLFLDKSQSADLISHFWESGHGKFWQDNKYREMIKELISFYRVRLPLLRLKADSQTTLTIDALSELSRCPRPLLGTLSQQDKNKFREVVDDVDTDNNSQQSSTYLLARSHQNRFIPLMMSFFEQSANSRLRFAIDFGHFYFNVRLKSGSHFTDNEPRVRRIGQKIIGYGHLQAVEKPIIWQQLQDNFTSSNDEAINAKASISKQSNTDEQLQLKPYLVKTFAHYHFDEHKIGFKLVQDNDLSAFPDLPADIDVTEPIKLTKISGQLMQPDFWMSPAQMLHLSFYYYLYEQYPDSATNSNSKSVDVLFNIYRGGIQRLFQNLFEASPSLSGEPFSEERHQAVQAYINNYFNTDDFTISMADLPKVIVRHLLGAEDKPISKLQIIQRAKQLKEKTEQKINQLEHLQNAYKKRGHKDFRPIKCGHIGDFLSEDLIRFQAVNKAQADGGKLNSQQYQILQATLAYYGKYIDQPPKVIDLFKNFGLLDGEFRHPFLYKLGLQNNPEKYQGLLAFYEDYLVARKNYLKDYIKETEASDSPKAAHWLRLKQISTLQGWFNENLTSNQKLKQPLPIAKNFFYQPILKLLADVLKQGPEDLQKNGMQCFIRGGKEVQIRPAISWFIHYYQQSKDDNVQEMYGFKRNHEVFDNFLDRRGNNSFKERKIHFLSEDERKSYLPEIRQKIQILDQQITEQDKQNKTDKAKQYYKLINDLKAYKKQEKVIRHTATQDILLSLYVRQNLKHLMQNSDDINWKLNNIENSLLNESIYHCFSIPDSTKKLFHPDCKIRKLGELRLLARDKRLPSLLEYYPAEETEINQAEIRAELNDYRRARIDIMRAVHTLEKKISSVCGLPEKGSVPIDREAFFGKARHGEYLYHLCVANSDKIGFKQEDFYKALLIRNAFAHSEYPKTEYFPEIVAAIRSEAIPENPALNRNIALRLAEELKRLYQPWLDFLSGA